MTYTISHKKESFPCTGTDSFLITHPPGNLRVYFLFIYSRHARGSWRDTTIRNTTRRQQAPATQQYHPRQALPPQDGKTSCQRLRRPSTSPRRGSANPRIFSPKIASRTLSPPSRRFSVVVVAWSSSGSSIPRSVSTSLTAFRNGNTLPIPRQELQSSGSGHQDHPG